MSDETIQYITTDYLIEVDGGDPTPAPIEYIVELGQVGVQGIPGEKGEPGFSPTVGYILNDNTFKINITNQDGVTQTPNLYDYFPNKNEYLKADGSNADNGFMINGTLLADNGIYPSNSYFSYELKSGSSIGYDDSTQYIRLPGFNLTSGSSFVTLNTSSDKPFIINRSNPNSKIYYHGQGANKEVATIGDIGNGTITLTQGGVTKGTFTTNQSGNTTIDLDAGGGSITNPLIITDGEVNNGAIYIEAGNTPSQNQILFGRINNGSTFTVPAIMFGTVSNPLSISDYQLGLKTLSLNYDSNILDLNASNELTVKGMVGADGVNAGSAGLVPAPTATDNTKFLCGDGTWKTVSSGTTYTAGTGIDITNDVISIDTSVVAQLSDIPDVSNFVTNSSLATTLASYVQSSSLATVATTGNYTDLNGRPNLNAYVTLDTTQTISGAKTFQDAKLVHVSDNNEYNVFQRNAFGYINIGNANDGLLMFGSGERPLYNTNSLAFLYDIPSNSVTTDTDQDITGVKTFVGDKRIKFKQYASNNKLGFTLYDYSNNEKGYLEFNPSNTIDNAPLLTLGNHATSSENITQVGFRRYSSVSGANGAYNLLTPLIADAKTPFSLTTTYTNFYLPLGFTDGTTTVKTAKSGLVDLSSILPTEVTETTVTNWGFTKNVGTVTSVNNVSPVNGNVTLSIPTVPTNISAFNNDSGYITNSALSGYATETWVSNQGYLTSSDISDMATQTWVGQQGYITGITSSDVTTALGYTPYSSSNPSGYTSNVGTVTSVNNVQPDSNGNVSITPTITVIDGGNA